METKPAPSARHNRLNWKDDLPPEKWRVKVSDAISIAGNGARLAHMLGITRGAVYQWQPPYRHDPYMPVDSAKRFLRSRTAKREWLAMKSK